jgi:hypothetical protein
MEILQQMHRHYLFVRIFELKFDILCFFECIDLINMILLSYPDDPPSSKTFYTGQRVLQTLLIILAVICIPWMLLGKPVYRIVMNKRRANVSISKNTDLICCLFYSREVLCLTLMYVIPILKI